MIDGWIYSFVFISFFIFIFSSFLSLSLDIFLFFNFLLLFLLSFLSSVSLLLSSIIISSKVSFISSSFGFSIPSEILWVEGNIFPLFTSSYILLGIWEGWETTGGWIYFFALISLFITSSFLLSIFFLLCNFIFLSLSFVFSSVWFSPFDSSFSINSLFFNSISLGFSISITRLCFNGNTFPLFISSYILLGSWEGWETIGGWIYFFVSISLLITFSSLLSIFFCLLFFLFSFAFSSVWFSSFDSSFSNNSLFFNSISLDISFPIMKLYWEGNNFPFVISSNAILGNWEGWEIIAGWIYFFSLVPLFISNSSFFLLLLLFLCLFFFFLPSSSTFLSLLCFFSIISSWTNSSFSFSLFSFSKISI